MGEPDEQPRPVDTRLLRTTDLIDLRLEAPGCTIETTDGGAELVAGPDASLIVHFPPQHLGEEVRNAQENLRLSANQISKLNNELGEYKSRLTANNQ